MSQFYATVDAAADFYRRAIGSTTPEVARERMANPKQNRSNDLHRHLLAALERTGALCVRELPFEELQDVAREMGFPMLLKTPPKHHPTKKTTSRRKRRGR